MAKQDDTTMMLMIGGGVLILGIGAFLFKDQIMGAIGGGGVPVPLPEPVDEEPPINQPTSTPKPTPISYLQGIDYYAGRIAEEIDKNDVQEVHRTTKLNIKAVALKHYKSDLKKLVEENSMQFAGVSGSSTSLNEKALRRFATILLKVADRMGIRLKPEARMRFELQRAGKYKITAQMAFTLS